MTEMKPQLHHALPCRKWRRLGAEDHRRLVPCWHDLSQSLSESPFWSRWFRDLVDERTGCFDSHFMSAAGLVDGDGNLLACAAEVEHFERVDASQILFGVMPAWRGHKLGIDALQAALALARQRGSGVVQAECGYGNLACRKTFRRAGMCLTLHQYGRHDYWQAERRLRSCFSSPVFGIKAVRLGF